jgi:hypothetical protein
MRQHRCSQRRGRRRLARPGRRGSATGVAALRVSTREAAEKQRERARQPRRAHRRHAGAREAAAAARRQQQRRQQPRCHRFAGELRKRKCSVSALAASRAQQACTPRARAARASAALCTVSKRALQSARSCVRARSAPRRPRHTRCACQRTQRVRRARMRAAQRTCKEDTRAACLDEERGVRAAALRLARSALLRRRGKQLRRRRRKRLRRVAAATSPAAECTRCGKAQRSRGVLRTSSRLCFPLSTRLGAKPVDMAAHAGRAQRSTRCRRHECTTAGRRRALRSDALRANASARVLDGRSSARSLHAQRYGGARPWTVCVVSARKKAGARITLRLVH